MTSQDTGWVGLPDGREMGELLFRPVGGADPVALVVAGVVWRALHEGGVLLEEGWVHFG